PAPTDRIRTVASLVGEARQAAGHQPGRDAHKGDARRRLSLAQRSPRDVSAGRAARVRCAGQVDAVATGTDQRAAAGLRRDMPMTACRVVVVKDTAALAHAAAELFVKLAAQTASARRPFHVLLAGGRTPKAMYALLASAEIWSGRRCGNRHGPAGCCWSETGYADDRVQSCGGEGHGRTRPCGRRVVREAGGADGKRAPSVSRIAGRREDAEGHVCAPRLRRDLVRSTLWQQARTSGLLLV